MNLWTISYVILWLLVIALIVLNVGMLRQLGLIQIRIGPDPGVLITANGLQRGVKAPDFAASDVHTGQLVTLAQFSGRRLLLVFLSTNCSACSDLVPHVNAFAADHRKEVETLIVCHGSEGACDEFATKYRVRPTLVADPANDVGQLYEVKMTPFAYLIDDAGAVLIRGVANTAGAVLIRGVANTWSHLEALLMEEGTIQTSTWEHAPEDLAVESGSRS